MASGSEIAGAAAGAAPLIPALIGRGQNKRTATGFYNQPGYDPNASNFGGYEGGLDDYRRKLDEQRRQIQGREAFTGDFANANYQRGNALGARGMQAAAATQIWNRATGQAPTVAEQIGQRQQQQAVAQQGAIASSARGRAGLAGANRNFASNVSNATSAIANNTAINAAQERERAENAAFGAFTGMRQGDTQGQQVDAAQSQFQAQQQQANRNANDQYAYGQQQLEGQALGQSLGAKVQNQSTLAGANTAAEVSNQQTANQNAGSKGLIETVGDFFSDRRAKYVLSDFTTKMPALLPGGGAEGAMARAKHVSGGSWETGGMGGTSSAMSGPAAESFAGQQGMLGGSAMGELQAHSDFATRFAGDPTAGMTGGFTSDERAKEAAFNAGRESGFRAAEVEQRDIADHGGPGSQYAKEIEAAKRRVAEKTEEAMRRSAELKAPPPAKFGPPRPHPYVEAPAAPREVASPMPATASPVDRDQYGLIARQTALAGAAGGIVSDFTAKMSPLASGAVPPADAQMMTSDFTAKMPTPAPPGQKLGLSRGGSPDPSAPKMQFSASTGWYRDDPEAVARQASSDAFDDEARATIEEDDARRETAALAAKGNAMGPEAQWSRSFGDLEAAKIQAGFDARNQGASTKNGNAFEASKIRSHFDQGEAQPGWLASLSKGSQGVYNAQFGSDFTTKQPVDAGEVEDWQARDAVNRADLGEVQRMRSPTSFKRDTPQDQARVKKAFEDRAGKDADSMLAGYKQSLKEGSTVGVVDELDELKPSPSPVAQANRTMEGQPYVYKPQFTPPDQKPGEPNFGFMAQNLEESPITATAVKEDPAGLKRVDAMKLLRILGASVADLQKQEDETRMVLAKGGKKKAA